MRSRPFALALCVNRLAMGAGFLRDPGSAGPTWIGSREARRPGARVFGRGLAARDLGLGAGALVALLRDASDARAWMAGHALADGADLVATLVEARRLPARPRTIALGIAGASTAIAAWAALEPQGASAAGSGSP